MPVSSHHSIGFKQVEGAGPGCLCSVDQGLHRPSSVMSSSDVRVRVRLRASVCCVCALCGSGFPNVQGFEVSLQEGLCQIKGERARAALTV